MPVIHEWKPFPGYETMFRCSACGAFRQRIEFAAKPAGYTDGMWKTRISKIKAISEDLAYLYAYRDAENYWFWEHLPCDREVYEEERRLL